MKIVGHALLGLSLAVVGSSFAAAQDAQPAHVPKVLTLRSNLQSPEKAGHPRQDGEPFVLAQAAAKWPIHYIALNSHLGQIARALHPGYDSFADWEKNDKMHDANPTLSADLEGIADGELLDGVDQFVFTYDPDLSYRPHIDLADPASYEVTSFHIKPGHGKEWHELVSLVKDAHKKAGDSAHWAIYEIAYGGQDGTYVALSPDKSMSEIDTGYAEDKQFHEALVATKDCEA